MLARGTNPPSAQACTPPLEGCTFCASRGRVQPAGQLLPQVGGQLPGMAAEDLQAQTLHKGAALRHSDVRQGCTGCRALQSTRCLSSSQLVKTVLSQKEQALCMCSSVRCEGFPARSVCLQVA